MQRTFNPLNSERYRSGPPSQTSQRSSRFHKPAPPRASLGSATTFCKPRGPTGVRPGSHSARLQPVQVRLSLGFFNHLTRARDCNTDVSICKSPAQIFYGLQALQRCSGLLNRRARGGTVAAHHLDYLARGHSLTSKAPHSQCEVRDATSRGSTNFALMQKLLTSFVMKLFRGRTG